MIFENKNYATVMYVSTILVLLLLLFNFADIIENEEIVKIIQDKKIKNLITGLAVDNVNNVGNINAIQVKDIKYSGKSYFRYFMMVFGLVLMILVLAFRYILPLTKGFT